jgi:hypothetical protein
VLTESHDLLHGYTKNFRPTLFKEHGTFLAKIVTNQITDVTNGQILSQVNYLKYCRLIGHLSLGHAIKKAVGYPVQVNWNNIFGCPL